MPSGQSYSYTAGANPEDLHKIALLTTPQVTPVISALGAGWDATQSHHEWPTDQLNVPRNLPVQEGATITPASPPAVTRMGNYTQLADRSYVLSDRQQKITQKNGLNVGIGQQMKKATIELKKDMEYVFLTSATTSVETGGAASTTGGYQYFINTANATWGSAITSAGTVVDCQSKALSEDKHLLLILQNMYNVHDPESLTIIANTTNKAKIDRFTGGAMRQQDAKKGTVGVNIKSVESSFGDVAVLLSRQASSTDIPVLDMAYWKKSFLQPIEAFDISGTQFKSKHGIEKGVQAEFVFECRNYLAGGRLINVG
jgi:hypothetical protein